MQTIEQMLEVLSGCGQPWLSQTEDKCWHASIKLPAPVGVEAKVSSDWRHKTPAEALTCVIARLEAVRGMAATIAP